MHFKLINSFKLFEVVTDFVNTLTSDVHKNVLWLESDVHVPIVRKIRLLMQ